MFLLRCAAVIISGVFFFTTAHAGEGKFSSKTSRESLKIIKRIEFKEGIPSGMLHAISLVETNIGRTDKYLPWPYTIRLNRYKSEKINDVDQAFDLLELLIDLGYTRFDVTIDKKQHYSLSAINVEDLLQNDYNHESIQISARSIIKYLENKKESLAFLQKLLDNKWYDFKIGVMQLSYSQVKKNFPKASMALSTYENVQVMVKQLKKIRTRHEWWESVGKYHSKKPSRAKQYVKNVWSVYQRVYKIQVK